MFGDALDCPVMDPEECPGRFCGRVNASVGGRSCYSECMACPRGYRTGNVSSECLLCSEDGSLRDYLYLFFFSLLCVATRLSIISLANKGRRAGLAKLSLGLFALIENLLAYIFTLLSLEPQGSLSFSVCRLDTIADFYPIFFNPTVDYVNEVHCNSEVAYPRYSMVFIFFGYSFFLHLVALTGIVLVIHKTQARKYTEFAWLLVFPLIVLLYAILPGLIYYSFEYVTIFTSVLLFIIVTTILQINMFGFKNTLKVYLSLEYWVFAIVSMLSLAFGIVALTERGDLVLRAKLVPLVLTPIFIHPIISFFASPKLHLEAYNFKFQSRKL